MKKENEFAKLFICGDCQLLVQMELDDETDNHVVRAKTLKNDLILQMSMGFDEEKAQEYFDSYGQAQADEHFLILEKQIDQLTTQK